MQHYFVFCFAHFLHSTVFYLYFFSNAMSYKMIPIETSVMLSWKFLLVDFVPANLYCHEYCTCSYANSANKVLQSINEQDSRSVTIPSVDIATVHEFTMKVKTMSLIYLRGVPPFYVA